MRQGGATGLELLHFLTTTPRISSSPSTTGLIVYYYTTVSSLLAAYNLQVDAPVLLNGSSLEHFSLRPIPILSYP